MKNYKAPELEIVKFSHEDIMTTSVGLDVGTQGTGAAKGEYIYEEDSNAVTTYGRFGQ